MERASDGNKRPTILTILCTLSLFAGTWGLMSSFSNYENANEVSSLTAQAIDQTRDRFLSSMQSGPQKDAILKTIKEFSILTDTVRIKQNALFGILSNLLTLIGVSFMYRLRRMGYGIYLLGIGVYVFSPLFVYGPSNMAGMSFFVLSLFVGLLFSYFYWRMMKYMAF